jgi:hypothetical protein
MIAILCQTHSSGGRAREFRAEGAASNTPFESEPPCGGLTGGGGWSLMDGTR